MGDVSPLGEYDQVLGAIVRVLSQARSAASRSVNAIMTATYWHVGHIIVEQEQGGQARAEYGEELIARLSVDLTQRFGRGFGKANLYQMRQFRLGWPPETILRTLSGETPRLQILQTASGESDAGVLVPANIRDLAVIAQAFPLPWSGYVKLLSAKTPEARRFYEAEALRNGWTVRQLDRQINSLFYERTAMSRDKAAMLGHAGETVEADVISAEEAIKDPLVLEFLGLKDEYSETDLEDALITHLAEFLLELGDDFDPRPAGAARTCQVSPHQPARRPLRPAPAESMRPAARLPVPFGPTPSRSICPMPPPAQAPPRLPAPAPSDRPPRPTGENPPRRPPLRPWTRTRGERRSWWRMPLGISIFSI
jgi:predicted nuclease of restriction endonuclease-like (RecB) superfamily